MIEVNKDDIIELNKSLNESDFWVRDSLLDSCFSSYYYYDDELEQICSIFRGLIKNHPFVDGNKRIAATLFIYFLNFYGLLYKDNKQIIDNNTLTAVTLLIAESNPKEKEIIIDLVMNFLD